MHCQITYLEAKSVTLIAHRLLTRMVVYASVLCRVTVGMSVDKRGKEVSGEAGIRRGRYLCRWFLQLNWSPVPQRGLDSLGIS
jgi:hypothetical protein